MNSIPFLRQARAWAVAAPMVVATFATAATSAPAAKWTAGYLLAEADPLAAQGLLVERRTVQGIPLLVCRPDGDSKQPLVIVAHGFFGNKESFAENLRIEDLARRGWCVVALDNRGHGERIAPSIAEARAKAGAILSLLEIRRLIKETGDDIPVLLDAFWSDPRIDRERVAMLGVSMGGFITWRALTLDPRIRVAVPIIASPYWEDIPGRLPFMLSEVAEAQTYAAVHNPALARERIRGQALLVLLGGDDPHLDSFKAAQFAESLRPGYVDHPEDLRVRVFAGVAHQFTPAMRSELIGWLAMHFGETAPEAAPATTANVVEPRLHGSRFCAAHGRTRGSLTAHRARAASR